MNTPVKTGFLLINKPCGISSYGCIAYIKKILQQKVKIGHAGTLDPFASGLLIVAIGREATRIISTISALQKTYVATGKLGELTDTLDLKGTVVRNIDFIPTKDGIQAALASFGTSYEQVPPLYSALKHEGYSLYKLIRQENVPLTDLEVVAEQKRRTVHFYNLELISFESPFFTITCTVSQGTYIRSLVNDIAIRAGSCATTYALKRTAIGNFLLSQAANLEQLNTVEDLNKRILLL